MLEKEDLQALRAIMREEIDAKLSPIQTQLDRVEDRLGHVEDRLGRVEDLSTRTALTIENEIRPAIGKLADGHELLLQKIDDLARKDEVEDEMTLFRTVLAAHSRDIAQLKKAQ